MQNSKKHQATFDALFKHVTAIENLGDDIQEVIQFGNQGLVRNILSESASALYVVQKILLHARDRIR